MQRGPDFVASTNQNPPIWLHGYQDSYHRWQSRRWWAQLRCYILATRAAAAALHVSLLSLSFSPSLLLARSLARSFSSQLGTAGVVVVVFSQQESRVSLSNEAADLIAHKL